MNRQEFEAFVVTHADWFHGRFPETNESLKDAEEKLGVRLPPSLKWLLRTHGYWHATGVDDLDDTVSRTLLVRERMRLPPRYILLNDWGDTGVIVIDTGEVDAEGEAPFCWISAYDLQSLCDGQGLTADAIRYPNYAAYTLGRLELAQETIEEQDVRYVPSEFPEGRGVS